MATPLGTGVVTSIARRFILDQVIDNIYGRNLMFFRLNAGNKKIVRGGTQIEVPLMYSTFAAGGTYSGMQELEIAPSDTIKNGAWDWRQYYVPIVIDGLTLIKTDSPDAIADFVRLYFQQAEMVMSRLLGVGVWNTSTAGHIDGIPAAVDDGTATATYGGLSRSANSWWAANVDSSTTALTTAAMQSMFGTCSSGGRHPTLIATTQTNYNRFYALLDDAQRFPVGPGAQDEILAQAGFTNLLFNGVPVVVDDNVPTNGGGGTGHHMYFLNEDYIWLGVSPRADFEMEDFQTPIYQDAMVSRLFWAGNLIFNNCRTQGRFEGLTS
jgi:hypothetical protein